MSSKRKHDESYGVHESRHAQIYGNGSKPSKKPRRQELTQIPKQHSPSSINAIKKRLRDVNRRLERSDKISAEIRAQDERAREAYQQELAVAEAEKRRQRMIKKYHMVKFFERQKASRKVKKIRKLILSADSTEAVQNFNEQLYEAEVDLNYTLYHPLGEVYISLYPKETTSEKEDHDQNAARKKPTIWYEIEEAMVNGTLERIRNRISIRPINPSTIFHKKQVDKKLEENSGNANSIDEQNNGIKLKDSRKKVRNKVNSTPKNNLCDETQTLSDVEEESDGGFFE
ncbi:rRNA-processing protein efg1 [Golovinomyces cichoracearum]|uniref:rRNA-processing protein EFG1 n=1 Tax=Golovinomyces cichoracearum TaxID=62708 RepID=A0A420ICM3_9PEZI|nr:rRNA-processing protein efg1 [Golovinomyces cichoracearum]